MPVSTTMVRLMRFGCLSTCPVLLLTVEIIESHKSLGSSLCDLRCNVRMNCLFEILVVIGSR